MKKVLAVLLASLAVFSMNVFAVPPDYTTLTGAIDMSTTTAAILAVAAIMMVVYITWKGAKMILRMFKGA